MADNKCYGCGMTTLAPDEYHPHAACLMFKACHSSNEVRANLKAVMAYGAKLALARAENAEAENAELREDAGKLFLREMRASHGNFEVCLESNPILRVQAEWAVEMLKKNDAPNFITTELNGAEFPVSITIQRMGGKTPGQLIAETKAEIKRLRDELSCCAEAVRMAFGPDDQAYTSAQRVLKETEGHA